MASAISAIDPSESLSSASKYKIHSLLAALFRVFLFKAKFPLVLLNIFSVNFWATEMVASEDCWSSKMISLAKPSWLKHGGWWPDYVPRLFKKSDLIDWSGEIHESPKVKGEFGYMKSTLVHLTARDMSKMVTKTIKYAEIEAKLNYKANHPKVNIPKIIYAPTREFIRRYILKSGFLDGTVGLIESLFQAYHTAVVLVYLWEIQNNTLEKYKKEDV